MKVKFWVILLLASLFFVGCVSTKNVPVADSDIEDFRNHTVTVSKRGLPDFAASTAGKAAFGLIGAAAMISEGNKIIRENEVEDPANYISEQLSSALSDKYELVRIDTSTSELESEDVKNISRVFKDADYVLDVRTINWSFVYFPSDWNNYRVIYSSIDRAPQPTFWPESSRQPDSRKTYGDSDTGSPAYAPPDRARATAVAQSEIGVVF